MENNSLYEPSIYGVIVYFLPIICWAQKNLLVNHGNSLGAEASAFQDCLSSDTTSKSQRYTILYLTMKNTYCLALFITLTNAFRYKSLECGSGNKNIYKI